MSPEEKKLEKLNKLFEMVNEDFATPDDLITLSETILDIISTQKAKIDEQLATTTGETSSLKATQLELQSRISDLNNIINRLTYQVEQGIAKVERETSKTLSSEIKRLERKIPTKTDLTGLESDIQALREGLNDLPTEFTINNEAIRDGLELLQGDERLDKSAIKGLDEWEEIVALARSPKDHTIAGVRLLRYLADVNIEGILDGQTLVWDTTTGKFIPGTAGTGGGHTIQDEGTPLTQRTNLNFVGAGVTVTDDAGNEATLVTITSGGGGAVDSVNGETGVVVLTSDDISDAVQTNKWATAAEKTKLGHISVTQAVDLDALEAASHAAVTVTDSTSIDITLTGQDITAQREALTGAITAPKNSNTTSLGSFTVAQLNTAISDADVATGGGTATGTNTGDQTSIVGITGTKAQFDTAVTDGNFLYVGDITQYTDELAQDAVGGMVDTTLVYTDLTPSLSRAALTGAITASAGSNTTALGSFTKSQLDTAVSDGNVLYVGDITQYTDELAQDAVGAMVATSIVYNDAGATLQRAALTGAITASQDSNTTALGSFTKSQLSTAVSDGDVLFVGDVTTNATHTGEVTGSGALTVDKTAITNRTGVTAAVGDYVLISDVSDTDNLKKVTVQSILDLASGGSNTYFNDIYIDQSGGTSDTYGVLSGTINGSNALFTVSQSAYAAGTLQVWLNGQLLTQGSGEDWVETTPGSGTFTFNTAPASGSLITVAYQKVVTNSSTVVTTSTVTELAQDAVGTILTDSSEIDFTYNDGAPSISASIVASSIDETKLDASVNASLDLADTAVQPAGITNLVTGPASATDNAIARYDTTTGKLLQNSGVTIDDNGTIQAVATTTTVAPLNIPAGTLKTTPADGDIESDGNCFYGTTDAGNRGYIPVRHFIRANATRTMPNDTNENAIFNSPTNGRLTLETGTYLFEMVVGVTAMSATSGNALLDVRGAGTATCNDWLYAVVGKDGTLASVNAALGTMPVIQSTPASMFTAGTGAEMWFTTKGTFTVTVAGTLIPSLDLVTAAAAVISIGSYFSCERIGDTGVVSVGQWD